MKGSAVCVAELGVLQSAAALVAAWNEYVAVATDRPPAPHYRVEAAYLRFYLALNDLAMDQDALDDVLAGDQP